jgi:hypothetical protein
MTLVRSRRAATVVSCLFIMGLSPHCPKQEYVKYESDLQGCPDEAFSLPDTVAQGEYRLSTASREPRPQCPGFKLYDLLEDRTGFATPDLGQRGVYVRLERREPCRLHVVLVSVPERGWEPTQWAEVIAQLVMQDSMGQPRVPAAARVELGSREAFKQWCVRGNEMSERPMAVAGSARMCT